MSSWKVMSTSVHWFNICVMSTKWILSCSISEMSVSSWKGRRENRQLPSEAITTKESRLNSLWRHGHYCSTGVLLWGLQACCTSFNEKYDRKVIDINAAASKLGNKSFDLLAVHALSGCDTMSYAFGKWEISALNLLLQLDLNLQVFTEPDAEKVNWMKAGIDSLLLVLRKVNGIS